MDVSTLSSFFAILSLACMAGTVVVIGALVAERASPGAGSAVGQLREGLAVGGLPLAALVAAVATAGSLYYSEVVGFVPCELCWIQRIFMYPSAILLAVAAFRRDVGIRVYALPLASIGACFSAYHAWIQAYPPDGGSGFCSLEAPCTDRHVWEFGFVSLPFMALSAFVFIIAALSAARTPEANP